MRRSSWPLPLLVVVAVGATWVGCDPIAPSVEPSSMTLNSCPAHSCSAYQQIGTLPECNAGLCSVCEFAENAQCISQSSAGVLLVSFPTDSAFAPGLTYAIPIDQLFATTPTATCALPACVTLPNIGVVRGDYSVTLQEQSDLGWYLGNPQGDTVLPAHATYRLLWPPIAEPSPCVAPAESTQLPVVPVLSDELLLAGLAPGPSDGGSVGFEAVMQPGCYELTLTPDSPFDEAFPPQVSHVTVSELVQDAGYPLTPDFTTGTSQDQQKTPPTFQVSRQGGLDGWTAFLRDTATLRPVSGVRPLQGVTVAPLVLATSHVTAPVDALTGTELVIAPPAGQPLPTEHLPAMGDVIEADVCYPPMPDPAAFTVTVTDEETGALVDADLLFQATVIDVYPPGVPCVSPVLADAGFDGGASDAALSPNAANFEFTAQGRTSSDSGAGAPGLGVLLPLGEYTVVVRPLDSAHSVGSQSLVVLPSNPDEGPRATSFPVAPAVTVKGAVQVVDGRPLNQATVVAIPQLCADGVPTTEACLPRAGATTTDVDGSYTLTLDHGTYVLSIRPLDGTGLPWWTEAFPIDNGAVSVSASPVAIPAPIHANVQLVDPSGNAIVNAIVRVYTSPDAGAGGTGPVEIGHSITDDTGNFDLVLAPSTR